MTDYVAVCVDATEAPDANGTGVYEDSCYAANGYLEWVPESSWGLPELTLEDAALIAGAILALWASAWAFRAVARMIEES